MNLLISLLLAGVMLAIAFEVHHWFRRANPQLASALLLIGIIAFGIPLVILISGFFK